MNVRFSNNFDIQFIHFMPTPTQAEGFLGEGGTTYLLGARMAPSAAVHPRQNSWLKRQCTALGSTSRRLCHPVHPPLVSKEKGKKERNERVRWNRTFRASIVTIDKPIEDLSPPSLLLPCGQWGPYRCHNGRLWADHGSRVHLECWQRRAKRGRAGGMASPQSNSGCDCSGHTGEN